MNSSKTICPETLLLNGEIDGEKNTLHYILGKYSMGYTGTTFNSLIPSNSKLSFTNTTFSTARRNLGKLENLRKIKDN